MRSLTRTSIALIATLGLAGTACGGSDGDSSADTAPATTPDTAPAATDNDIDSFCATIAEMQATSEAEGADTIDEEATAELRGLIDIAPDEIRGDLIVLVDLFEEMSEIDESDPDSAERIFGMLFDPAVIEAGENLERFGVEECGLEPEDDLATGFEDSVDFSESDLDDPLYDPFFDDPVDPDVASLDGLKLFLDDNYPDATWRPMLSSFGRSGDDLQAGGIDVEADALAICQAVLDYATRYSPDATAQVVTFTDFGADEIPVAEGDEAGGCALL